MQIAKLSNKAAIAAKPGGWRAFLWKDLLRHKFLYLMILPVLAYYAVFHYAPMYGITLAFQDYNIARGIRGSEWVGMQYFVEFFRSPYFTRVIWNTLVLNFYGLIFVFPAPIVFALLLNELRSVRLKKTIQTMSYLPFFISIVVISGIIKDFTSQSGVVTYMIKWITGSQESMNLLTIPEYFRAIYTISEIWQNTGFNSIIYISALSAINPELYEAAIIDGAGRWKQMIHITLTGIMPTIIILFILQLGSIMSVGFDKVFLLYNPAIYSTADVISTYIYRQGLEVGEISYSTAVGLFNTVINFFILIAANTISRKASQVSLF